MRTAQSCNAFLTRLETPERSGDGALSDLTFSVKDNIAVDGYPVTGASPVFKSLTLPESQAVTALRAAGAGFIGTTNLHELAFGITGSNAHSGDTLNPHNADYLAGGSSAGAAVSVATGDCDFALGTDTGGSCRIPAAHCGVVGFRPSIGRYANGGILTLSETRDTLGVLAKDVATLRRVDAALSGETPPPDAKLTLGLVAPDDFSSAQDSAVVAAFDAAIAQLKKGGANIVGADLSSVVDPHEKCGFAIAVYESAKAMGALAQREAGLCYSDFVAEIASEDVRGLFAIQANEAAVPEAVYQDAIATHLPALRAAFEAAFAQAGADVLVYPTVLVPPVKAGSGEMMMVSGAHVPVFPATTATTGPDSTAGLPSVSVPCGWANGFPVGLMLTGRIGMDAAVLAAAAQCEAIMGERA